MIPEARKLHQKLYFQVVVAIAIGATLGYCLPEWGVRMKPFGDGFIKLIKMMVAPIIFTTVVTGIAKMRDMEELGRLGIKTLVYFEVVSSLALVIGLIVVNLYRPGAGINADPASLDAASVENYVTATKTQNTVDFLLNIIPSSVVDAFAKGEILQVLLFSILFGLALARFGKKGKVVVHLIDLFSHGLFGVVGIIMKLAPIGAFGAMAFTIGKFGIATMASLLKLMASVYITSLFFVFGVLGLIARLSGFSLWKFLKYIKEEILIVLGTSSSESVLPRMIVKLENMGCAKSVVGLVIPTGYSFNLDGTSIYLTMAAVFISQATNIDLSIAQQLTLLGVLLLTSKGAAAVTGGGFITLAATLSTNDLLPVAGLSLLLGVDRFMSEARAITNLIGNGVATIVIARWENALDENKAQAALESETAIAAEEPETPQTPKTVVED